MDLAADSCGCGKAFGRVDSQAVTFAWFGLSIVMIVAGLSTSVLHFLQWRSSGKSIWDLLSFPKQRQQLTSTEKKINEIFCDIRLARYKICFLLARTIGTGGFGLVILIPAFHSLSDNTVLAEWVLGGAAVLDTLVIAIMSFIFGVYPKLLTLRKADFVLCAILATLSAQSLFVPSPAKFTTMSRGIYSTQFLVAAAIGDSQRVFWPILASFILQAAVLFANPELQVGRTDNLVSAIQSSIMIWVTALIQEVALLSQARTQVQLMEASISESMTSSLLDILCDAVVRLRSDLVLAEKSPRLDALLFRRSVSAEEKRPFEAYLDKADVDRFNSFVDTALSVKNKASSIPVHLVDSMGRRVAVQLFHTTFPDLDNNAKHIIGIMEDREGDMFQRQRFPGEDLQPSLSQGSQEIQGPQRVPEHPLAEVVPGERSDFRWDFDQASSGASGADDREISVQASEVSAATAGSKKSHQPKSRPVVIKHWGTGVHVSFTAQVGLFTKAKVLSETEGCASLFSFSAKPHESFLEGNGEMMSFIRSLMLSCAAKGANFASDKQLIRMQTQGGVCYEAKAEADLFNVKISEGADWIQADVVVELAEPRYTREDNGQRAVNIMMRKLRRTRSRGRRGTDVRSSRTSEFL